MKSVCILGAGKIGRTLQYMLDQMPSIDGVIVADSRPGPTVDFVVDASDEAAVRDAIENSDGVVSALPFSFNKDVAAICASEGKSYFDFTEDTDTTAFIQDLAILAAHHGTLRADQVFAPQCGLAPGAINIIGASIAREFDSVRSLEMRVGALPLSANNAMKYYLSWSSAGLINEYLQPCDALYRGKHIKTQPLEGLEEIIIDGVCYEAFNTSGGVATMCETFADQIETMTYKTIRYPGHRDHMKFVIEDLNLGNRQDLLTQIFDQEVPLTGQDVVILYVNAVGSKDGKLIQRHYVKKIEHDYAFTAIQKSTAAGMAAVIEMWADGVLSPGFVRQEDIDITKFLHTQWGRAVYG